MSRRILAVATIFVVIPIAYVAWQAMQKGRAAARFETSRSHLKQIGLALHSYHEEFHCFPPAYVLGPDGKPWHSWRVLLLPFLDEKPLAAQYRFDEPWDGPHNRLLIDKRPKVYDSPLQTTNKTNVVTYLGVVSRRTMWPAQFCVKIADITDGTSNTIFLVENVASDVVWSEPRDMREKDALAQLRPANKERTNTSPKPTIPVMMVDGSVRRISTQINRDVFVSLLTPQYGAFMVADGWPREERPGSKLPEVVEITKFPGTRFATVPDGDLAPGQTSLYCATSQLAWDLLRPNPGKPIEVSVPSSVTDSLNSHPFPVDALADESYIALIEGLKEDASGTMLKKLTEKFPAAPVTLLANPENLPGVRVLTYLQKSMPFPDVMEPFPLPLEFGVGTEQRRVNSFGWPSSGGEGGQMPVLSSTVEIRDYVSNDDFIVVLHSDGPQNDDIFLAKIAPQSTLQQTWESATNRIQSRTADSLISELRGVDQLQIPVISFGIVATLKDLVGVGLPTEMRPLRYIADARQSIRFRLDEYGAELIADTSLVVGDNGDGALHISQLQPRRFIFDRPFLLALKEKKGTTPYFLAWIGNADLMEPAKP